MSPQSQFEPAKLADGAPACVHETYGLLISELDRKQGMITDLHEMSDKNFGLSATDSHLE